MSQRVAVIDYGMGNLRSVAKAIEHVGGRDVRVQVSAAPEVLRGADRVVFPGQGAMGDCMAALARLHLLEAVGECLRTRPFLGICLGFQALLEDSEEDGGTAGLGLLAGRVERFPGDRRDPRSGERLKVPHMGWNTVEHTRAHPLWAGIDDGARFYFVHSYHVQPRDAAASAGDTEYGLRFCAAAAAPGWFATQFHPEKSAGDGLLLLRNFLAWDGRD